MDKIAFEDQLDQAYSSNELKEVYLHYFSPFIGRFPNYFKDSSLDQKTLGRISISKKNLIRVMATVFSQPKLLLKWLEELPEAVYQALQQVAWEGSVMVAELEKHTGEQILEENGLKAGRKKLKIPYCLFQNLFFKSFWGAEGNTDYLDLPGVIRKELKQVLPAPEGYTLDTSGTGSPCEADFQDAGNILNILPLVSRFIQQGELEKTRQGFPSIRSLLRLKKICNITEFYSSRQPAETGYLRTRMVAELLLAAGPLEEPGDAPGYLGHLFERYLKIEKYPHDWFFSHIRGLVHCREGFSHRLQRSSWELLKNLPEERWITVSQLRRFAKLRSLELAPVSRQCADRYLYFTTRWEGWGNKKRYLTSRYYDDALVIPALKASLFMFASFGLLDLSYGQPLNRKVTSAGKPYLTVFDGLEAVRLTSLGAAVTKQRPGLPQASQEMTISCELDPERLFIRCTGPEQLVDISLERFGRRIGPRLYLVDAVSFLRGCNNADSVLEKIRLFKTETEEALPPLWQQFFDQLVARTDILKPVSDLLVFRLTVDSERDVEAIAGDRILKELILKAERRHILVRKKDLDLVKKRLEELGFLM